MLLICSNSQIDVLYPLTPFVSRECVVSELSSKHKQTIPMRLIGLTALFSMCVAGLTAFFQKDRIELDLLQEARKALSAAGLPPVSIDFEGRAATLTGLVGDTGLAEEVATTVNTVFGVRKVANQLEVRAVETVEADPALESVMPEFEDGLYVPPRFHPLEKYNMSAVQFVYGTATLTEASFPVLDKLAMLLKQNEQIHVELSVHTDNQGTALGQMTATELRAETLRQYLLAQEVNPARLMTTGYGSTRPVAYNDSAEGRQQNRRVEIVVLKDR